MNIPPIITAYTIDTGAKDRNAKRFAFYLANLITASLQLDPGATHTETTDEPDTYAICLTTEVISDDGVGDGTTASYFITVHAL